MDEMLSLLHARQEALTEAENSALLHLTAIRGGLAEVALLIEQYTAARLINGESPHAELAENRA